MNCFNRNKTYLIFGTGITGKSAVYFCEKHHLNYFITDDNEEKLRTLIVNNKYVDESRKIYKYNNEILKKNNIDYLILSPSIHSQFEPHKIVIIAREIGIEIIPDIDLFYCFLQDFNNKNRTNKKLICITGTNGKSTTTALTAHLLNNIGLNAIACGNIGINVLSLDVKKYDYFVVEMSSYNLFLMNYAKFECSVLLNITEDHLAYHGTMENYANAKEKALLNSDFGIICIDTEYTKHIANKDTKYIQISTNSELNNGFYWKNNTFYKNGKIIYNGIFQNLIGKHNIENILCSVVCCKKICENNNIDIKIEDIFEKVKGFQGLKHRIQFVRNIEGIDFYNDSKGTNADSTQKALNSFEDRDIYLIAGGQRKTAGFYFLKNDLKNVKCIFLIGDATESFAKELKELHIPFEKCEIMKNAINIAFHKAKSDFDINKEIKPVILLSPLCASWDQYKSFEERGDDFIKIVENLEV